MLPTRTALLRQGGLAIQRQVLGLQRRHGNRYVGDLFTRLPTPREPVPVVHHWTGSLLRQATSAAASQPNIPQELLASVNLRALDNGELRSRHDRIIAILSRSLSSTVECELLLEGVGDIGVEVARRQALEAGRTFPQTAIDAMRAYFVSNAQSASPDVCIVALNKGMRLVLADPTQKMGSDIASSMAKLQASGRVEASHVVEFEDSRGRITNGIVFPDTVHESIWDTVIRLAAGDPGWSVFGMSITDGYHSVTLALDNSDPSQPHIFWSDQWSTKGGWMEHTRAGLDAEVTQLTQSWWGRFAQDKKPNTRLTLWRIRSGKAGLPAAVP